jgi:thiol-activated cytolysin
MRKWLRIGGRTLPSALLMAAAVGGCDWITAPKRRQREREEVARREEAERKATAPAALVIDGGDGQAGTLGTPLKDSLSVLVTNQSGVPLGGIAVRFAVTAGTGSVSPSEARTGTNGIARAAWTLGGANDQQSRVTAAVGTLPAVVFQARGINPNPSAVRELIAAIPDLPAPPNPGVRSTGKETAQQDRSGDRYVCTTEKYTMDQSFSEVVAFNPNAEVLWPGALVQGATIQAGTPALIPARRAPATITIEPSSGRNSAVVENPTNASVLAAVQSLAASNVLPSTVAKVGYDRKEAYSLDQAMLSLGLSASWLGGGARAALDVSSRAESRTVFVKFVQAYFPVGFTPPASPELVFDAGVTRRDIEPWMSNGNPPGYIASVTYGRILIFKVTATSSHDDIKAALDMSFQGGAWKGDAALRTRLTNVLQQSQIQLLALGGDARDAVRIITANNLKGYFESGATYSPRSPGTPISYTVKFLRTNRLASLAFTTNYEVTTCSQHMQRLKVTFDTYTVGGVCENTGFPAFERDGEFFWDLKVTDVVVARRSYQEYVSAPAGRAIPIGRSYELALPMARGANSRFTVSGWVRDQDNGRNELVGEFSHTYSYDDRQWNVGSKSARLYANDNCHGTVYYRTERLP